MDSGHDDVAGSVAGDSCRVRGLGRISEIQAEEGEAGEGAGDGAVGVRDDGVVKAGVGGLRVLKGVSGALQVEG